MDGYISPLASQLKIYVSVAPNLLLLFLLAANVILVPLLNGSSVSHRRFYRGDSGGI